MRAATHIPATSDLTRMHRARRSAVHLRAVGLAITATVLTAGCLGGDDSPTVIGAEAIGAVTLAEASEWGDGRARLATTTPSGTTVVVTTTELVSVQDGVATLLDRFDATAQPTAIAASSDQPLAVVGFAVPPSIRVYRLDDGSSMVPIALPTDAPVTSLMIAGNRILATTPVGAFFAPLGGGAVSAAVDQPVSGLAAMLPDGTVFAPVTGTADLVTVTAAGAAKRTALDVPSGETLLDARLAPNTPVIAVTSAAGADAFERQDRVTLLDAATLAVRSEFGIGTAIETAKWAVLDDAVVVADDANVRWFSYDGVPEDVSSGSDSAVVRMIALAGNLLTVHADGTIIRWPTDTRVPVIMGSNVPVGDATADAGGATVTITDIYGAITVRSTTDAAPIRSIDLFATGELTDLAVGSDGQVVVTSTLGLATVLDPALVKVRDFKVTDTPTNVSAVAFAPTTTTVAVGIAERLRDLAFDDTVQAWDAADGRSVFRIGGEATDVAGCAFFYARLRFSPDGRFVATTSHDFSIEIVDVATGDIAHRLPGEVSVLAIGYSPEGDRLVASSDDGIVRVWDTADYSLVTSYRAAQGGYYALAPLADGVMAAADITGAISIVDIATGTVRTALEGATQRTSDLAVSADGTLLAAPAAGGAIAVWSTLGGPPLAVASGHTASVTGIAFGPSGDSLLTASADGTVRSWTLGAG